MSSLAMPSLAMPSPIRAGCDGVSLRQRAARDRPAYAVRCCLSRTPVSEPAAGLGELVPGSDHGSAVLSAEGAQRAGVEAEEGAGGRRKAQAARGEHPQEVGVGDENDIAAVRRLQVG